MHLPTTVSLQAAVKVIHGALIVHGFDASHGRVAALVGYVCNKAREESIPDYFHKFASQVFDQLIKPNSVTIENVLGTLCNNGDPREALRFFHKVNDHNTTLPILLKSCEMQQWSEIGNTLHGTTIKLGFMSDIEILNSLVSFYSKQDIHTASKLANFQIGRFSEMKNSISATEFFKQLPVNVSSDVSLWNSMLQCYIASNSDREAMKLFDLMKEREFKPDLSTLILYLKAWKINPYNLCHQSIEDVHKLALEVSDGNLSVHYNNVRMYCLGKLGFSADAKACFLAMKKRNLVSWNTVLNVMALSDGFDECFEMFKSMISSNVAPNERTLLIMLTACVHAGNVDTGMDLFHKMESDFAVVPNIRHFGCMVNLLGRKDSATRAYEFIEEEMQLVKPNEVVWMTLLCCCKEHEDIKLAEWINQHKLPKGKAFKQLLRLYGHFGYTEKVAEIQKLMEAPEFKQYRPAFSMIV